MRATFILDAKRKILYAVASPVNVGRSVSETLRVVRALRSGNVPADWQPGDDCRADRREVLDRLGRPQTGREAARLSNGSPISAKSSSASRTAS